MILLKPLTGVPDKVFVAMLQDYVSRDQILALSEILGDRIYDVLSVLAGEVVRIPNIKQLSTIYYRALVFYAVEKRVQEGLSLDESYNKVASEYKLSVRKVRSWHEWVKAKIKRVMVTSHDCDVIVNM